MDEAQAYLLATAESPRYLRGGRRAAAVAASSAPMHEGVQCMAFYADCSGGSVVCAEGSTCRNVNIEGNVSEAAVLQCVPNTNPSQMCAAGSGFSCPTGWRCSESTEFCVPATNYVCYLPTSGDTKEKAPLELAADSDGTYTAIEAIFQILLIAANKQDANSHRHEMSTSGGSANQQAQLQTNSSSTSSAASRASSPLNIVPPQTSSLGGSSSSGSAPESSSDRFDHSSDLTSSSSSGSTRSNSSSNSGSHLASNSTPSPSGSLASENSMVKVSLTEPVNGGVYSLSSVIVIQWHVSLLSGPDPGLDSFRVEFSADNGAFDIIAPIVLASSSSASSQNGNDTVFEYEWDLAGNASWLCSTCVLRICLLGLQSASGERLCIRSDGKTDSDGSTRRLQTTSINGSEGSEIVTFRIVREALECACGVTHESFMLVALTIGAGIPVVVLLAEPLVTFYRDRQAFGLFARRDGPVRPVIAGYSSKSATRKGRIMLLLVLLALCVACGFVAAQITETNFLAEKGAIIILWVVTFAIAAVLGVLVYCTLICFVLFGVRWWRERIHDRRDPSGLTEFQTSLLPEDERDSSGSIKSPW
ncbi:unnamed protein product [Phytophthora fragariaefolia]|uniref:Unnamed protein product n=1 Tax=Phytophthora fragariaefolia TaxID=1490495 RepID=A0A9W6WVU0_9STRA|nr:unnamed protein product [Phytophthora fragariaefolia]